MQENKNGCFFSEHSEIVTYQCLLPHVSLDDKHRKHLTLVGSQEQHLTPAFSINNTTSRLNKQEHQGAENHASTRGVFNSSPVEQAGYLKNYPTNFNQTWQARVMVTAHCVTITQMQKVKGQGHTRPGACSTAHQSNRPDHWDGLCQTGQLLDNFHTYPVEENGSITVDREVVLASVCLFVNCQSDICRCCHFVLLDNDESCPTADLSNIGHPNGPAYLAGELLNTPQKTLYRACKYDMLSVVRYTPKRTTCSHNCCTRLHATAFTKEITNILVSKLTPVTQCI